MKKPFRAFMENIIDYAGLFPPAALSMDESIRNYAKYRASQDAWMLSRFICPASRLKELQPYKAILFNEGAPFRFSVLLRPGENAGEFLSGLSKDIDAIKAFREFHGDRIVVDAIEAKIPTALAAKPDAQEITDFLGKVAEALENSGLKTVHPFYEGGFPKDWQQTVLALSKAIADHNSIVRSSGHFAAYQTAGYKIRCGGVAPADYPSPEQIAFVIDACLRQQVAIKGTAGLHHPVRHFNKAEMVKMHGFLNLFGGIIAAEAHNLDRDEIQEIIADEDSSNFLFSTRAFAWNNLRVSLDEIKTSRQKHVISFGSCSFDEPREDLRKLKLL